MSAIEGEPDPRSSRTRILRAFTGRIVKIVVEVGFWLSAIAAQPEPLQRSKLKLLIREAGFSDSFCTSATTETRCSLWRSTSSQGAVSESSGDQAERKLPSFAMSGPTVSGLELAWMGLPLARFAVVTTG